MLKKIGIFLGIGVLIGGAIFAYVFMSTGDAEKVVEEHFELLRQGQTAKAYATTTSEEFRQTSSLQDLETLIEQIPMTANVEKLSFPSREITNNNYAYLEGTLTTYDNIELYIDVDVVKENGEWLIFSYHIYD